MGGITDSPQFPSCISNTLRFCASYAPSTLLEKIDFEGSLIKIFYFKRI
ncbi:MAG: hypothetical protein LBS83_02780 [Holosporales bacterium]|nr:hypothetical protein [Holosporales bacterium]